MNGYSNEPEKLRRQAAEDLEDIRVLKASTAFNRYWLRHLAKKKAEFRSAFENDPPSKCSHEEREILRRLIKLCEELEQMPDTHTAIHDRAT